MFKTRTTLSLKYIEIRDRDGTTGIITFDFHWKSMIPEVGPVTSWIT
jgi:hypothetical protein